MAKFVLREYQEYGVDFGIKNRSFINGFDPGLGKTIVPLEMRHRLGDEGRMLIMCSRNAINTWQWSIAEHFGDIAGWTFKVVEGTPAQRAHLWRQKTDITITTFRTAINDFYGALKKDPKTRLPGYRFVVGDEIDRAYRNHSSSTAKQIHGLFSNVDYFIPMTGTVFSKGDPSSIWAWLHTIDKAQWPSYWKFVGRYCLTEETRFGKQIVGANPDTREELKQILYSRYLVRVKKEEANLPAKNRYPFPVGLDEQQQAIIGPLLKDLWAVWEDSIIMTPNRMAAIMAVRKLLCCPRIIDPSLGLGAAFEAAVDHAEYNNIDPYVMFVGFRDAIPHFKAYFDQRGIPCYYMMGGISTEFQADQLQRFRRYGGVMLCTTKYAQSFELTNSYVSYHLAPEWEGNDNVQAEDRLNRLTQPRPTMHYYMQHMGTPEEALFERLGMRAIETRKLDMGYDRIKELLRPKYSS
jgi:hypothetical protein